MTKALDVIRLRLQTSVTKDDGVDEDFDHAGVADAIVEDLHLAGYVIIRDRTDPEGGIPGRAP